MNYYTFHIGDYAGRTRHLSLMEDLAYRRLLDLYYSNEEGIPLDIEKAARLIGMKDYIQDVSNVISDFFLKSDAGYIQERCEEQIKSYQAAAERARNAGILRWSKPQKRKKKAQITEENLTLDALQMPPNNQEPTTNNQEEEESVPFPDNLMASPDFCNAWKDYFDYRRTAKMKTLQNVSRNALLKRLSEWGAEKSTQALRESIANGWQGVFEPRGFNKPTQIIAKPASKSLFANDENVH